jgi:hypothetical protein
MTMNFDWIKEKIKNNELIGYEHIERFKNNHPAVLLFFEAENRVHAIGQEKFEEFKELVKGAELRFRLATKSFYGVES